MYRCPPIVLSLLTLWALSRTAQGQTLHDPPIVNATRSVAKIHSVIRAPDLDQPWARENSKEVSGSGILIDGNRILTNAHVVSFATEIYIQWSDASDKIPARVTGISRGIDLALLELIDAKSLQGRAPARLAEDLPALKETVEALGFPEGGASLSITKGVVSRIEFSRYYYGASGLRVQIDAAINHGNSGGPAFTSHGLVGLVYGKLEKAEGISYLIPAEEIRRFISGVKNGVYDPVQLWRDELLGLENPAVRAWVGAAPEVAGVVVIKTAKVPVGNPLRRLDVLTHIGKFAIDNYGQIELRPGLRVPAAAAISRVAVDGRIPVKIWRKGKVSDEWVPLFTGSSFLVQSYGSDPPEYFVYGPLVFETPSQELIVHLYQSHVWLQFLAAKKSGLLLSWTEGKTRAEEQLVIAAIKMLPHPISKGYSDPALNVLRRVDGKPVRNISHLVELLRDGSSKFVEFEFSDDGESTLVFVRDEVVRTTEEILEQNGIRRQGSEKLLKIWNRNANRTSTPKSGN